jgi:hypothetical protein
MYKDYKFDEIIKEGNIINLKFKYLKPHSYIEANIILEINEDGDRKWWFEGQRENKLFKTLIDEKHGQNLLIINAREIRLYNMY